MIPFSARLKCKMVAIREQEQISFFAGWFTGERLYAWHNYHLRSRHEEERCVL